MALNLRIENVPNLPDGGPVEITVTGKRGIDIGRDSHLDWTLPDPTRHISGKHAEIRYKEGGYWLHDVSTNGTYLSGSDHRMQGPHRLRNGDRFAVGHYIIAVALDGEAEVAAPVPAPGEGAMPPRAPDYQELWSMSGDSAPPIDRKELRPAREASPLRPDFLDWAADVPVPLDGLAQSSHAPGIDRRSDPHADMDWARGAGRPVEEPAPPPPMPAPRRPAEAGGEPPPWEQPLAKSDPRDKPGAADVPAADSRRAPPPPVAAPPPLASRPSAGGGEIDEFLRALAGAAGISEEIFTQKDPQELARQLGDALRVVVENLSQLLQARLQAKRLVRSTQHTVIQATENNPLKFSPSTEDALRIMFGPPTRSYLDAHQALVRGFEDVKTHQVKTYSAMQRALTKILAELDPQVIDRETGADRGIAAVMTSRKASLWDAYVARWQAKQHTEKGGLIDAFMLIFSRYYDEAT